MENKRIEDLDAKEALMRYKQNKQRIQELQQEREKILKKLKLGGEDSART